MIIDRIKALELNDKGLRSQISELVAEKEKCEEQIDELGDELESRIKQLSVNILNIYFIFIYYYILSIILNILTNKMYPETQ